MGSLCQAGFILLVRPNSICIMRTVGCRAGQAQRGEMTHQKCSAARPPLVQTGSQGIDLLFYATPLKTPEKNVDQELGSKWGELYDGPADFLGRVPGCGAGVATESPGGSLSPGERAERLGTPNQLGLRAMRGEKALDIDRVPPPGRKWPQVGETNLLRSRN